MTQTSGRPGSYGRPGRGWFAVACLTLAVLLAPVTEVTAWAEQTLLSAGGFAAALAPLPREPAVQQQVTAQITRLLKPPPGNPAAGIAASLAARAVPAVMDSPAFLAQWHAALTAANQQAVLILRSHRQLPAGTTVTVQVPVTLARAPPAGILPPGLEHLLPATITVSLAVLTKPALSRARTTVRLTDMLSRILIPAEAAAVLAGLAAARRRRRALTGTLIPAAAITLTSAFATRVLTQVPGGSPLEAAAARALTAPLTTELTLTSAACAGTAAVVMLASRLLPSHGQEPGGNSPG